MKNVLIRIPAKKKRFRQEPLPVAMKTPQDDICSEEVLL
jgi:hypothetical protein